MYTDPDSLVQKIHSTEFMATIATTGGGTYIFPLLLEKGNGSKTLIGGYIPYDTSEHEDYLGGKSDRWVAEQDARSLAMASYLKAQRKKPGIPVIGLGATVSLMRVERDAEGNVLPERPGRMHSIYVAVQTQNKTVSYSLAFQNNQEHLPYAFTGPLEIRIAEERLSSLLMLNLLAEACNLEERVETGAEDLIIRKEATSNEIHPSLTEVIFGTQPYVAVMCGDGLITPMAGYSPPNGLIPGSFNPIHLGHRNMRSWMRGYLSQDNTDPLVGYEIAVKNVDKPPIDLLSLRERLTIIAGGDEHAPVFLTNTPKFVDKSRAFHNCWFGVGYDTASRIVDAAYYEDNPYLVEEALHDMQDNSTRFMVFGRQDEATNDFFGLEHIQNKLFSSMSLSIREGDFRQDIRSRDIRRKEATQ